MEFKTIKTPRKGTEVKLKEYITGGDMRELRAIYLEVGKLDPTGANMTDLKPEKVTEAENKTIELVVMEVDGKTENILQTILGMPSEDYNFILDAINEIAGFSKKK